MDQFALTSSRLELGEEENLVVRFFACPAVLRSLPGLVVLPALHTPIGNSVMYLFFIIYCIILLFYSLLLYFLIL